jgi:peptide/nickel transport system permease protein
VGVHRAISALRHQWGLDRGLVAQYFAWLGRFLVGDWGQSFRTGQPILFEFVHRFPASATLGFGGLAIAVLLAVPLGFFSARRPRGVADMTTRALNVLHQSVPSFWLGLILLWFLGVKLQFIRPFTGESLDRFLLPLLIVGFYSLGALARVYRAELIAVTREPFFITARAKGLSEAQALWAHGHKAALYTMVLAIRPEFAWVVGGTAVMEVVFALPGISQFLVQSVAARDYFVLQAYVVVIAAWMLVVNLVVTALLRLLDPRTSPQQ